MLKEFVSSMKKGDSVLDLIKLIRKAGRICSRQLPTEMVIGNIIRRVLFIIRDDYARHNREKRLKSKREHLLKNNDNNNSVTSSVSPGNSIGNLASPMSASSSSGGVVSWQQRFQDPFEEEMDEVQHQPNLVSLLEKEIEEDFSEPVSCIKFSVIDGIKDLISELENVYSAISDQATEIIQGNEVILTYGSSKSVECLLLSAAKKRSFHVIIVENPPTNNAHQLIRCLVDVGIKTTLILNTAVFGVMQKVDKVIIGTSAVMANGGLIAPTGTHQIALAANYFSIPVIVVNGLFKLTPLYPIDHDTFNNLINPKHILPFEQASLLKNVNAMEPEFDYVPPELIKMFVTNDKNYITSYIYRLLAEFYHPNDYNFEEKSLLTDEQKRETVFVLNQETQENHDTQHIPDVSPVLDENSAYIIQK